MERRAKVSGEKRRTNWLLLVGAIILSAWIVCWTGLFIYSLGAGHGQVGTDLPLYILLMYAPLWLGILFVWMGALWPEE